MNEPILIRQSQAGYKREFVFSEGGLTCKLRDSSGEREFTVPYEAVDMSAPSTLTLNNTPFSRRASIALVGLGIVVFIVGSYNILANIASIALYTISAALLFAVVANSKTGWLSAKFTVMRISPPPPGTNAALMVLNDDNHDKVMAALTNGWKARLKTLYGRANPDSDHQKETDRLKWLLDRNIIDNLHYHEELARLTASDTAVGFTVTH